MSMWPSPRVWKNLTLVTSSAKKGFPTPNIYTLQKAPQYVPEIENNLPHICYYFGLVGHVQATISNVSS